MRAEKIVIVAAGLGLLINLGFQACGNVGFTSGESRSHTQFSGGEGFDGKLYASYGDCAGKTEISDIVMVARDFRSARKTRERCQTLQTPAAVSMNEIQFLNSDSSVLKINSQVFDEQVASGVQRITAELCTSVSNPVPVQVHVFSTLGNSALQGEVSEFNGPTTGILAVTSASTGVFNGSSGNNSLDLDVTGNLRYSLGGISRSLAVQCASQSAPIRLVQQVGVNGTRTGANFRISTAATQAGNLIAVGITHLSTLACTQAITDDAGNVFVSAGPAARDSNGGTSEIWYAANSRPGGQTLTLQWSASCAPYTPAVFLAEFSGLATGNPLSQPTAALSNQSASTTVRGPILATPLNSGVLFGVATVQFDVLGLEAGSPFTLLPISSADSAAFLIHSAPGSYGPIWTQSTIGTYGTISAHFRPAW